MGVYPPGTHFTAESTEAMQIMCLAQEHNILMPVFEPSTSVSRNWHSNHITNMLQKSEDKHTAKNLLLSYSIFSIPL